jgi:signal recognition particle GTPase
MKHDIHAETARTSDLFAVAAILAEHRGEDNPITSGEIATVTGLDSLDSTPRTRGVIRRLTEEHGLPIAASNQGYYMIADAGEASEYLRDLEQRKQGIKQRQQAVGNAVEQRGLATNSETVSAWLTDLESQLLETDSDDEEGN